MKKYYLFAILFFLATAISAQTGGKVTISQDSVIVKKAPPPPPPPPPPPAPEIEEQFRVVENPPRFLNSECEQLKTKSEIRACAQAAFEAYIYDNLEYPEQAYKERIEGLVFVEFRVDRAGNIRDIKVAKDIGGDCGEEVYRLIENSPKWAPKGPRGSSFGRTVKFVVEFNRKAWKKRLKNQKKS